MLFNWFSGYNSEFKIVISYKQGYNYYEVIKINFLVIIFCFLKNLCFFEQWVSEFLYFYVRYTISKDQTLLADMYPSKIQALVNLHGAVVCKEKCGPSVSVTLVRLAAKRNEERKTVSLTDGSEFLFSNVLPGKYRLEVGFIVPYSISLEYIPCLILFTGACENDILAANMCVHLQVCNLISFDHSSVMHCLDIIFFFHAIKILSAWGNFSHLSLKKLKILTLWGNLFFSFPISQNF